MCCLREGGRLRFARPTEGHFEIGEQAAAALLRHRQLRTQEPEAGGLLLGRLINESEDVIADQVTEPSASDRRGRFRFFRQRQSAQRFVDRAWIESFSTRNYLGEWHTHPEDVPSPSSHDLGEWSRIVATSVFEQKSLFFVIVGRVCIRVWEYAKGADGPVLLNVSRT
jgi:integrative and conjugative element protein (TIGR02256 family)